MATSLSNGHGRLFLTRTGLYIASSTTPSASQQRAEWPSRLNAPLHTEIRCEPRSIRSNDDPVLLEAVLNITRSAVAMAFADDAGAPHLEFPDGSIIKRSAGRAVRGLDTCPARRPVAGDVARRWTSNLECVRNICSSGWGSAKLYPCVTPPNADEFAAPKQCGDPLPQRIPHEPYLIPRAKSPQPHR